jgi:Ca-activated chloride channel family protein
MFLVLTPAAADAIDAPETMEQVGAGSLLLRTETEADLRHAVAVNTHVSMRVTALINRVHVTQRFANPSDDWAQGVYVFPLPEEAAVDRLRMRVGERLIEGQIQERQAARKSYKKARESGHRATLVEQQRPNVFTSAVANIGPGESVQVEIEYQQVLHLDDGRFHLRFPMVVAPRYIPGRARTSAPSIATLDAHGWAWDTDQVPDASRITPPVIAPDQPPLNPVTISVHLDAGFPLRLLESTSHDIVRKKQANGATMIHLAHAPVPAERDFTLSWAPAVADAPRAALFTEDLADHSYALLMVAPPGTEKSATPHPSREVIFVVDTSGSMGGASIRQARAALSLAIERLHATDRFNIIAFSDRPRSLYPSARDASSPVKVRALVWVQELEASGGTEMASALRQALSTTESEGHMRQVVFLTDGAVGNEGALFELIRQHLGASRLFTIGIGSAPNGHFMTRAARFGRGTYTYIDKLSKVSERMGTLFRKLERPLLTDIDVAWPQEAQAQSWPARVPDLYAGEPIVLAARLADTKGVVTLSASRAGEPWALSLPLSAGRPGAGIATLWARRKIAALTDRLAEGKDPADVRSEIVSLALHHHLVGPHTSLVAVDTTPARALDEALSTHPVATNLPAGWHYEKVFGRLPQTATPAPLLLIASLALLLLAGLLRERRSCD